MTNYQITGLTIAVTNMESMLDFYTHIFDIQFVEKEMFGARLYSGQWGGIELLFCPAEIAQNTAKQNRHQFDILVPDLKQLISQSQEYGGQVIGEPLEDEESIRVGIYDPDQNSIVFKQLKS